MILLALWQGVQLFRAKLHFFEISCLYDKQPNASPKQEQWLNVDMISSVLTQSSDTSGIALCYPSALKCTTALQKDLERLEKWTNGNLMMCSKVPHLGWSNPVQQYRQVGRKGPRALGGQVEHEAAVHLCRQQVEARGYSRLFAIFLLARLLWAHCVQLGDPPYKKGADTLGQG